MTQAISQRDQAIIIINKAEKRPQPLLFAHYQKNRFFGHYVRCFRVKDDEDATRCVLNNVSQLELSLNSYIVICNGVTQTTEQLAIDFFQNLPPAELCKKRKAPDEASTLPKKQKVIAYLGLTPSGKVIVDYVTNALKTGRWNRYFTHSVLNQEIHRDYRSWCLERSSKDAELDPAVDIRPFMKTLRGVMPTIRSKAKNRSQIPAEDKCIALWADTKKELQESAHVPSYDTLRRYLLSSDRQIAFKDTIPFSVLYSDYCNWCLNEGYTSRKSERGFIAGLSSLEPCQVFWTIKRVTFGKTFEDQKTSAKPLLMPQTPQNPLYNPFPKERTPQTVYSKMTQLNKTIVHYIGTAFESGRWHSYFSKKIASATIHGDYCRWRQEISLSDKEISLKPFSKALHHLLPNILGDRKAYQHFPTEQEARAQWQRTLHALEKPKTPIKKS
jgi:hypothetical protein